MHISFTEPTAPSYIYVNPINNLVHLMMPIISGTEIGLDNTCQSVIALQEFFGKSSENRQQITVLNELTRYQEALRFDISLIIEESKLKEKKLGRLAQINYYIELINKIQSNDVLDTLKRIYPVYPVPLQTLMKDKDSNLYSMVLRPTNQDFLLRSVNPVFSVNHNRTDANGNGVAHPSVLYQALHDVYDGMSIVPNNAQTRLTAAVIASPAGQRIDFKGIQQALSQKVKELLGVKADFTKTAKGEDATQAYIDEQMGYADSEDPTTTQNYVEALLGYCTPTLFDTLPETPVYTIEESPFYTIKTAEELSILTQFFLATVNIYCRANQLSPANFGQVLDASSELSTEVAARVFSALSNKANIEDALLDFVNTHQGELELSQALTTENMTIIKKKFTEHYFQIKDSPHFDEFMVLDSSKPGKFVTHQGSICTDFCEFLSKAKQNSYFINEQKRDFARMNGVIAHKNEWIADRVELNIDELSDEQLMNLFKKLPPESQQEMFQSNPKRMAPIVQSHITETTIPKFLDCVAKGQQKEAEHLLMACPFAQYLLLTPGTFTDYSGRKFYCTAYQYATWAKDSHMLRMLERYMDDETKASMLALIEEMERNGLAYEQHGNQQQSHHFDLKPLIDALQEYLDGYDNWDQADDATAIKAAWMKVGLAQRDVPAHVAHEYCRRDRSFSLSPSPSFNVNEQLPRELRLLNRYTNEEFWYPLDSSTTGMGFDFAVLRRQEDFERDSGAVVCTGEMRFGTWRATDDLNGIKHLDKARDADLELSREILRAADPESDHRLRI